MAMDLDNMLQMIKDRQWALADIDWEAPGAELITDEQRPNLKQFMSDVVWIEHVGAQAFAAMAPKAGPRAGPRARSRPTATPSLPTRC